ncbi:MAG TPA: hypothetical protein VNM45_11055, partial [Bacillus sp. (in: firmicutes)]|nr:hypothetical protein [Bacillus sp. (in: firmicutes)]
SKKFSKMLFPKKYIPTLVSEMHCKHDAIPHFLSEKYCFFGFWFFKNFSFLLKGTFSVASDWY